MSAAAPIEAVFLGLDPAKHTSGAVVVAPDYGNPLADEDEHPFEGQYALHEYGKVESQPERERFTEAFIELALDLELPAVVVAEEWDPPRTRKVRLAGNQWGIAMDPKWTYKTVLGMGEGWGRWAAELESASAFLVEEKRPPLIIVRKTPNDWRDALWGARRGKSSEAANEQAHRYFEGVFGFKVTYTDVAVAGCISLCGTTDTGIEEAVRKWHVAAPAAPIKKTKNQQKAARRAS